MDHIKNWVFDLDNTLYKAECGLFDKVHILMGKFIEEKLGLQPGEAQDLRTQYYHKYGTTLRGLMSEHNIDPDEYLDYVHQINYDVIVPNKSLSESIKNLDGKKYIFTNANYGHVVKVLDKLKMTDAFDGCFDISESNYVPKPHIDIYEDFQKKFKLPNNETAMFEDLHINLKYPYELGWKTVWITNNLEYNLNRDIKTQSDIEKVMNEKKYINYTTDQLENFLNTLK
jgi:putative hydrolase of the HAD superfamily